MVTRNNVLLTEEVVLWSDSTYGHSTTERLLPVASAAGFPLRDIVHDFGAGYAVKGLGASYTSAPIVAIELGYNDSAANRTLNTDLMRHQPWFLTLSESQAGDIKNVILIPQSTYRQGSSGGGRKLGRNSKRRPQWSFGQLVETGLLLQTAADLINSLGIPVQVLDSSPGDLFDGFHTVDGDLWQLRNTCFSYVSYNTSYTEDGQRALWDDALHFSAFGAELHLTNVVQALLRHQRNYSGRDFSTPTTAHARNTGNHSFDNCVSPVNCLSGSRVTTGKGSLSTESRDSCSLFCNWCELNCCSKTRTHKVHACDSCQEIILRPDPPLTLTEIESFFQASICS